MCIFFSSHRLCTVFIGIPEKCLLYNFSPVKQNIPLPANFVFQSTLDISEGVHVFQLCTNAKLFLPERTQRNICITTKAALLHVSITDIEIAKNRMKFFQITVRLSRRPHIRFRNNLQKRGSCTIQIYIRNRLNFIMNEFSGILFHMHPGNTYCLF